MRKLFSLLAAVLFAGSMMASVTILPSDFTPVETSNYSTTKSGVTVAVTASTVTAEQMRIFKNQTITISVAEGNITGIEFTCTANGTAKYGPGCFAAQDGYTFEAAGKKGTWAGSATSVVFTAESNQVRATQIVVLLNGEGGGEPIVVEYDTLNVAQAIDTAALLADGASSKEFFVEGYAVNVAEYSTEYKNQDFYFVDDVNAPDSILLAFRATPMKNAQAYKVLAGDKLRLFGKLKKYVTGGKTQLEIVNPTVEFLIEAEGDRTIEEPEPEALDTITVKRALEIGAALESGKSTDVQYVIGGYVSNIVQYFDTTYKNETFWMTDTLGSRAATNAAGAFEVYRGVPTPAQEIGLDAFVYVTSKIQNYQGKTIETAGTPAVNVVIPGTVEEVPVINVDSALKIGKALASGGVSELRYEITGYVSNVYTFYNPDFKNETVWITDDPNSTSASKENAFEIYRGKPSTQAEAGWGAKVKIVCKIKNYNGTIENDGSNITFEVLEPSTYVPDTITVEDAIAMTANLADNEKLATYSVVKGFVRTVTTPYDASKNIASFELADYATGNASLATAYQATILKADAEKVVAGSYAVVTGYLMKHGSATQIAQGAITAFEEAPTFDTIYATPSEAQAAGLALEDNKRTQNVYVVTGYVVSANSYDPEDDDFQTFLMADEKGAQAIFKALNAKVPGNGVKVGDQVTLTGNIFKYVEGADISIYIENGEVEIIPAEGIENVVLTEEIQKVIVDGVLYIIRDGKMFNAQGVQVR